MATKTNLPAAGQVGTPPPAHAPIEISQPLRGDAGSIVVHAYDPASGAVVPTGEIITPADRARENERQLQPLAWKGGTPAGAPTTDAIAALERQIADLKAMVGTTPHAVQAPRGVQEAPHQPVTVLPPPTGVLDTTRFPAGSNSDSPTRGVPGSAVRPSSARPALQILGGFGEADAEYFPLNGTEAKVLVEQLLDEVYAQIQNDLRFSVAITYPRLTAKLSLTIQGEALELNSSDPAIEVGIEKVRVHDRTPIEVAQARADSVVFVVVAQRREFDDRGEVDTPADAIRESLGLTRPRKQYVQMGTGKVLTDVTW